MLIEKLSVWFDGLGSDVRTGLRGMRQRAGFTTLALATLALGIGANTAVFSILNAALFRQLPIAEPDGFVSVSASAAGRLFPTLSFPHFRDIEKRTDVFSGLIAYRFTPLSVSEGAVNERLWGYSVTGNYFDVLGLKPAHGRLISPDDDRVRGGHPVTVISHQWWRQRFGGDSAVVGRQVFVNGRPYTIVGVAPAGFAGTEVIAAPQMWFPITMQAELEMGDAWLDARGAENVFVQGRLRPGVSRGQAQSALNTLGVELAREFPQYYENRSLQIALPGFMSGAMRTPVLGFAAALLVVVGLALLLACASLANLLLARATERAGEMASRLALGASRARLVRQLLVESVLLSLAGGALGSLLARWATGLASAYRPPMDVPANFALAIDTRVWLFALGLSALTGVVFGLLPALRASRTNLVSALKHEAAVGSPRASWLKNGLAVFQIALSLVLLVGGGLMLRSLRESETIRLGLDPNNAVAVSFDLRLQGYEAAQGRDAERRLLNTVRAMPGVEAAGIGDVIPVDLHMPSSRVAIEGGDVDRPSGSPRAFSNRVSPGYFAAMGTRVLRGREFTDFDDQNAPRVAIVNETFARTFWPDGAALGRRFRLGGTDAPWIEVVGIAEDGKYARVTESAQPFVYRPMWQSRLGSSSLVVRSKTDPQQMIAAVRSALQDLDPRLPIAGAKTMTDHLSFALLPARLAATVLAGFGALALAIAAVGLYGMMSYTVAQRTREFGIRAALGAPRSDIERLVVGQGLRIAGAGIAIGVVLSFGLTRVLQGLRVGVGSNDPLTLASVAGILLLVAAAACYLPARRATLRDPVAALRSGS